VGLTILKAAIEQNVKKITTQALLTYKLQLLATTLAISHRENHFPRLRLRQNILWKLRK